MNKQTNRLLVGFFSLGAVSLLIAFGFFTGSFSFLRQDNERFVLVFHENVYGLHEGSKVTLNGVRIGRVERFFIGEARQNGPVPVQIEVNRRLVLRHMVESGNEIFDSDGGFKKEIIPHLLGQLNQESFVTGILYINLTVEDFASAKTETLHGFPEIVTKGSIFAELSESINLDQLSKQINDLIVIATDRLRELDVEKISSDLFVTTAKLRDVLDNLSASFLPLGPSLTKTSEQSRKSLLVIHELAGNLKSALEPNSEFRFELDDTLRDFSSMARSLKNLADLLEENPQAFIIGKPKSEE